MSDPDPFAAALEASGLYRVEGCFDEGGQGHSYSATNLTLGRREFVKFIHYDGDARELSLREPRALASVLAGRASDNVVQLYDARLTEVVGESYVCIHTELVDGRSVASELVNSGPFPQQTAVAVACASLKGVCSLHALGFVHRDLKSGNVVLARPGATHETKIADLGSVIQVGTAAAVTSYSRHSPVYTPPEAWARHEFGRPTDVYQTGLLLHEMASGIFNYNDAHWVLPARRRALIRQGSDLDHLAPEDLGALRNEGIHRLAERRVLTEHARPTLAVVSRSLVRAIRAATFPDPARRPSALQFLTALQALSLPNWKQASEDSFEAADWKGRDVRLAARKTDVVAEVRGAAGFRRWTSSPAFQDLTAAATWVEAQ